MACTSTLPSKINSKQSSGQSSGSTPTIGFKDDNPNTSNVYSGWNLSK